MGNGGGGNNLSEIFEDSDFGETHFAGEFSAEDIFRILESLEDVSEFPPVSPLMEETGMGSKDGEETITRLISQKSSSSSAFQESETELESSPKNSKRQKLSVTGFSEEIGNQDWQQRISHLALERNRRKLMNELLSVLRSLMPSFYVKRGDQASIIGGVIDYINELQQVLQSLEAKKQRKVYSDQVVLSPRLVSSPRLSPPLHSPKKPPLSPRPLNFPITPKTPQPPTPYKPRLILLNQACLSSSSSSSSLASASAIDDVVNELAANSKSAIADVEVKFSGSNVVLKTISSRIPGQAVKIMSALEDLSLEILQVNISTIDQTMLNSFTIKIGIECQLSAEELAHQIQQTFCEAPKIDGTN